MERGEDVCFGVDRRNIRNRKEMNGRQHRTPSTQDRTVQGGNGRGGGREVGSRTMALTQSRSAASCFKAGFVRAATNYGTARSVHRAHPSEFGML